MRADRGTRFRNETEGNALLRRRRLTERCRDAGRKAGRREVHAACIAVRPVDEHDGVSAAALLCACASTPVEVTPVERGTNLISADNAETLLARGYYEKAAAAYRKAIVANPDDAAARYGLAEAERLSGDLESAVKDYQQLMDVADWKLRAVEGLARRDLSMRVKERILMAGAAVIVLLMVTVIYNDIARLLR